LSLSVFYDIKIVPATVCIISAYKIRHRRSVTLAKGYISQVLWKEAV